MVNMKDGAGCDFFIPYRTHSFNITAEFPFSHCNCNTGTIIRERDIYVGLVFDKNPSIRIPGQDNISDILFLQNLLKNVFEDGSRHNQSSSGNHWFTTKYLRFLAVREKIIKNRAIFPK